MEYEGDGNNYLLADHLLSGMEDGKIGVYVLKNTGVKSTEEILTLDK